MSKLNFYLRPSVDYSQITSEDAVNLEKMVEYLQNQEKMVVSSRLLWYYIYRSYMTSRK